MRWKPVVAVAAFVLPLALAATGAAAAETIRFGVSKIANNAPVAVAIAKGYFAAEGLDPQLTFFESQAPVAVAVGSGSLDFGDAAETAALYNLAAGGRARVIASGANEAPTFHSLALVASNQAYAAGLKTPKDLPGHSFALTQMGTGLQYNLNQLAKKVGFDVNTLKLMPLQSNPNIASALSGGRADAAVFDSTNAQPLIDKGEVKLLGWVGDLAGYAPAYLVFASRDMVDNHGETVKKFLAAMRKAYHDYYDAFTDEKGLRKDGPTADATLAMIAKFLDQAPDKVKLGLPEIDRDGRVDMPAVQDQIDWYRSIGAIKGELSATTVVDERYATKLPEAHAAAH